MPESDQIPSGFGGPHGSKRSYRAYELDDQDHVVDFVGIPENSDEDAIAHMLRIADGRVMELWERGRLIKRTPPAARTH